MDLSEVHACVRDVPPIIFLPSFIRALDASSVKRVVVVQHAVWHALLFLMVQKSKHSPLHYYNNKCPRFIEEPYVPMMLVIKEFQIKRYQNIETFQHVRNEFLENGS